jgi:hypothetical protein
MKQQNPWTTSEYRILREAFARDANVSSAELCKLLPMHTRKSIDTKWVELGLRRPEGAKHQKPGWASIVSVLQRKPMSCQEIAEALGCTRSNVRQIMSRMRSHWHIAGYRPSGHYAAMTPILGLGAGENASYPKKIRQRKSKTSNPFSIAAGEVKPIEVPTMKGRVYNHLWDDKEAA